MLRHGQAPSSQVLEQARVVPSPHVAAQLGLPPAAAATKIVRLRLSQEVPLLLETVFVPQALAPGLEHNDLSQTSLYALLETEFGVQLHHAQQTLEVTTATEDEAHRLGVAPGAALLLLEGTTSTAEQQPVEAFIAVYRGDKFKFFLESQRLTWDGRVSPPQVSVVLRSAP